MNAHHDYSTCGIALQTTRSRLDEGGHGRGCSRPDGLVLNTRVMTSTTRIQTPFGFDSTAAEVIEGIDLSGQHAIVTGASSGIGVETARALASAGAAVTLAVRNTDAGERTATQISDATGNDAVDARPLDLADPASVAVFAGTWPGPLHIARYMDPEQVAQLRAAAATTGATTQTINGAPIRFKTIAQGAATSVLVATSPQLEGIGGRYFEDCNEAEKLRPEAASTAPSGVAPYALHPDAAERLWALSLASVRASPTTWSGA